jgi:hypothetical protein
MRFMGSSAVSQDAYSYQAVAGGWQGPVVARPAAVLADRPGGGELAAVYEVLTQALDTPAVLLRHPAGPSARLPGCSFAVDEGVLDVDGCRVRPAVVWSRHAALVPADGRDTLLRAACWSRFLDQLAICAHAALPGTAPLGSAQLADAARLGVRTPRTIVTTRPRAAARLLGARRIVVKTPDFRLFEPDQTRWPAHLPRVLDAADVPADPPGGTHPLVVQEYVAHVRELRVYYVNGGLCAFEVRKPDPASQWSDPARVAVSRTPCPPAAAEAVRTLCAAWSLRYGAFDLLVPAAGPPVFLEANPDGDWRWYERRARWPGVSVAAAAMVRALYAEAAS